MRKTEKPEGLVGRTTFVFKGTAKTLTVLTLIFWTQ